jgi:hypothetical protein
MVALVLAVPVTSQVLLSFSFSSFCWLSFPELSASKLKRNTKQQL